MANPNCPDCRGTGRIMLLTSTVPCECDLSYRKKCEDLGIKDEIDPVLIAPKSFAENSVLKNAWYSREDDKKNGHCYYLLANGGGVKITEVNSYHKPSIIWPDLEYIGVVERWISGSKH